MSNISIFKNCAVVSGPEDMDLILYLEKTRDGEWEDIVTECRLIKDEKERKIFKSTRMPTATLSGLFNERKDSGLYKHSGYISMDLDDVENVNSVKRVLENDRYVVSVFISTSGNGLRVLFKIDGKKHRESFNGICSYLFERYGITCDTNGINVSKPYLVSYDPYLYINPDLDNVPVFKAYVKETVIKPIENFVYTKGDFESILKQIVGKGISICEDYHDWIKVGFAISEHFGENGRFYFHEVSRMSRKYDSKICDKQYTACIKARGTTKANISTFYYLAKLNNISIYTEQTKTIQRATRNGKKVGLNKTQIIENLLKFNNISNADSVVNDIFDTEESKEEEEESLLFQLEMYISNNFNLRMNEITGYLENNEVPLSSNDINTIFISSKKLFPKLDFQLMMRLLKSDFIPNYNPFFKFFGSDGIPVILPAIPVENGNRFKSPLIDLLASTIENDNPAFTLFFLRKWIVSIVSAAHKVHSPLLLCLLGVQNSGKTEFFRRLLPPELQPYYAESKLDKEKDDELLMTENLVIMDDELGGKSKKDALKINHITSKQYFSLRRPYGEHNEKILRLAVLCGTSNYKAILNDPTGNRRIIPVEVNNINKVLYNSINKSDLFKEAFALYKEGFDWRVTINDIEFLNKDKATYEVVSKEKELIRKYFIPGETERVSSTDILVEIEILTRQKLNLNSIGREMENLGFIRKSTREKDGGTPKKWCVDRINRSNSSTFTDSIVDMSGFKKQDDSIEPF